MRSILLETQDLGGYSVKKPDLAKIKATLKLDAQQTVAWPL